MQNNVKLTIRISEADMAQLKSHTNKTHLTQSGYLRMLIRAYVPKAYPPELFMEAVVALHSIGGALTEIADAARLRGEVNAGEYQAEVGKLHLCLLRLQSAVTAPQEMQV